MEDLRYHVLEFDDDGTEYVVYGTGNMDRIAATAEVRVYHFQDYKLVPRSI